MCVHLRGKNANKALSDHSKRELEIDASQFDMPKVLKKLFYRVLGVKIMEKYANIINSMEYILYEFEGETRKKNRIRVHSQIILDFCVGGVGGL